MDLGLKGRVAIVAAASKGLGRAVALELACEGASVAICAPNADDLESAAREMESDTGRRVFCQALDVTDAGGASRFVVAVEERFGRVDICVTNAGGPPSKTFLEISPSMAASSGAFFGAVPTFCDKGSKMNSACHNDASTPRRTRRTKLERH